MIMELKVSTVFLVINTLGGEILEALLHVETPKHMPENLAKIQNTCPKRYFFTCFS